MRAGLGRQQVLAPSQCQADPSREATAMGITTPNQHRRKYSVSINPSLLTYQSALETKMKTLHVIKCLFDQLGRDVTQEIH